MSDVIDHWLVEESTDNFTTIARNSTTLNGSPLTPSNDAAQTFLFPPPLPAGAKYRVAGVTATAQNIGSDIYTHAGALNPGVMNWLKGFLGSDSSALAIAYGAAVDANKNLFVGGTFRGSVVFNQSPVASNAGSLDCFLAKFDPSGNLLWYKTFGAGGDDSVYAVAVDSQGNAIVAGAFHGAVDFGGTTLTSSRFASGAFSYDAFLAKYDPSGNLLWVKQYGGTFDDLAQSPVAVDSSDNILMGVRFQSQPADFGSGFSFSAAGSSGKYDIAIVKVNSSGTTVWAKQWGGTDDDLPSAIAVDSTGNVYVCGVFWGTTNIGGGNKTSNGAADMFVAKYSGSDGSHLWSKTFGGVNNDNMSGIAIDPTTGNVLVTGGYAGTIDFGGGNVASGSGGAATSMFLAEYAGSDGTFRWVKVWGGDIPGSNDNGKALVVDASGNLIVAGLFSSFMDFNRDGLEDAPGSGFFIASFTLTGNNQPVFNWAKRAKNGAGVASAVAIDSVGHVACVGTWQSGTFQPNGASLTTPGTGAFMNQYNR